MTGVRLQEIVVEYIDARDSLAKIEGEHWRYPHQAIYDAHDRFERANAALRVAATSEVSR